MKTNLTWSLWLCCCLAIVPDTWAQTDSISGIINQYSAVTNVDGTNYGVTTSNPNFFNQGDKVLLIQMKGANYNSNNNSSFGSITSLNGAGSFNILTVCDRDLTTGEVSFDESFVNTYATSNYDSAGIQLVTVPQYANDVLIYSAPLTAQAWNGQTGGVLILEAAGTVRLADDIDVSGLGYRGGQINTPHPSDQCDFPSTSDYLQSTGSFFGAGKGEGIGAYPTGQHNGRGPLVNGGGGGNDHNAGGGGGANVGAGGQGGRRDPGRFSPFCRGENPGLGGYSLSTVGYSNTNRFIFMGGGGGSGHQNNNRTFPAGKGGGIVIITAQQLDGNNQALRADGTNATNSGGDGGSGGGAGGTILLDVNSFSTNAFTISADGGTGANSDDNSQLGPGGGGGGGMIWTQVTLPGAASRSVSGATPGLSVGTTYSSQTHNAASGQNGTVQSGYIAPVKTNIGCILPVYFVMTELTLQAEGMHLRWQLNDPQQVAALRVVRKDPDNQHTSIDLTAKQPNIWVDPVQLPGQYFYQLIATDLQGQNHRSVWLSAELAPTTSVIANAYLTEASLAIQGWTATSAYLQYQLVNSLGQTCLTGKTSVSKGNFHLQIPHTLPKGVYILRLTSRKFSRIERLIIR